ncbi:hypothetical protein [Natrinema versiforme]|uniref:Uncharacterized protein n=1 Tax=Natrinema versiforme JCM 10478 TaxID=1227496 RepID=L9XSA5_9EURY|nr:hypothetical protein [Natrinema versiforme]ELY64422.1 hypothetical protein C489_16754 [Natrinema versiforme JCM 10478]
MNDTLTVGSSLVAAIVLAGIVGALTESPAVLGITAAGIAIYLAVGIGLPQYLLSRRRGSTLQVGLAVLAIGAAASVVAAGVATGTLHDDSGPGFVAILLLVVLGNAVGAGLREFRSGYRSAS